MQTQMHGRDLPIVNQGVESEEHYNCVWAVFYEIRGRYHCLFEQGFGPLCKLIEWIQRPRIFGNVLAWTQEMEEVVKR